MTRDPSSSSKKPDLRKRRGDLAEAEAAAFLERLGYRIKEKNWRCRTGELDIVAADGDTTVIVEVRSRKENGRFGTAIEAVTPRKCMQVRATAQVYLRFAGLEEARIRFDVVAVTNDEAGRVKEVRHLVGAF
ncbi:YraN family protein [Cohnella sp. GbtcB17]|uniref:YraN family protein n=1 Tax=Cohnella sp. GbtcB17 TaxID=2824762 RepID=UPI001C300D14|nr:YraN family protein [Cohnella sp. GbtcB17]